MSVGRSGPTLPCCQAGTPDMPEGPFDEAGIMSEVIEYPAPDLDFSSRPETLYERERRAFRELLPENPLQTHFGQYVVIHDGKVVASGSGSGGCGPGGVLARGVRSPLPRSCHRRAPAAGANSHTADLARPKRLPDLR